ncbi:MAG: hypothetical protein HN790_06580 [Methylococcales bacterium]|jgi:HPt (histidine-containing phosphotransfer) domain-containing protein/CheY-like chemotaxis protein|nr:hypothetical protein [Methylococcales bacterium]
MSDDQSMIKMQQMLAEMKASFVADLPSQFDEFEQLIIALERSCDPMAESAELCREVHSIKGAAGTHGLPIITTICHHLEDQLQLFSDDYIEHSLRYIDLMREALDLSEDEVPNFSPIEEKLSKMRREFSKHSMIGLVVESSKLITMIEQDILSNYPVELTFLSDGLIALEHLLSEKFDFIITSQEVSSLNGIALISAVRASDSTNKNIKAILLTSKEQRIFQRGCEPDAVTIKNNNLATTLVTALEKLMPELAV